MNKSKIHIKVADLPIKVGKYVRVAQLGEHLLCKQGVRVSSTLTDTKSEIAENGFIIRSAVVQ